MDKKSERECMPPKKVSIIIVAWNNAKYLSRCFEAVSRQTFTDYEVIVIDNGSDDIGVVDISTNWPTLSLRVERLSRNLGFAVANNIGARLAQGQWLALLNADAFPEPDWLERLLEAAERYPDGFFASRQIQANTPGLLDGEGDVYHISGLAWRRNYGLPVKEKYDLEEIFSPCAAAALYPRKAFLDAGGFDEDYFSYQEDVDLGFRLRLKGFHCYYVPHATVHHVGSASTGKRSDFAIYHGHRNIVWTYVKNMPGLLFWFCMPLHLVINFSTIVKFFLSGYGRTIWRAKLDAAGGLQLMFQKRKQIQLSRQVSLSNLYRVMNRSLIAPIRVSIARRWFENRQK